MVEKVLIIWTNKLAVSTDVKSLRSFQNFGSQKYLNYNLIVKKNTHKVGFKYMNFEFLAVVGQFKLKKNATCFCICYFMQKNPLVSLLENILYYNFCQTMVELGQF